MTTNYHLNNILDSFTDHCTYWITNYPSLVTTGSDSFPMYTSDKILKWFDTQKEALDHLEVPKIPHNVVFDADASIVFEIAATNATKENIKVSSKDNKLKVVIKRNVDEKKVYFVHKLSNADINFEYPLTEKYDLSKTKANLKLGILYITIPMKEEAKPKIHEFNVE